MQQRKNMHKSRFVRAQLLHLFIEIKEAAVNQVSSLVYLAEETNALSGTFQSFREEPYLDMSGIEFGTIRMQSMCFIIQLHAREPINNPTHATLDLNAYIDQSS